MIPEGDPPPGGATPCGHDPILLAAGLLVTHGEPIDVNDEGACLYCGAMWDRPALRHKPNCLWAHLALALGQADVVDGGAIVAHEDVRR